MGDREWGQGAATSARGRAGFLVPLQCSVWRQPGAKGRIWPRSVKKRHSWEKRPKNWGKGRGDGEEILIVLGHSVEVLLLRGDHLQRTFLS